MRRFSILLALTAAACSPSEDTPSADGPHKAEPTYLFAQTAKSAVLENNVLTLTGISPSMLWFTDRPERMAGHVEIARFIESMTDNPDVDSFENDPPNATLSVFDSDGDYVTDVAVELLKPKLEGDTLTYGVNVLDGADSVTGGPASLFIDPIGRPLSPVSVAGHHRRVRRSYVRHAAHRW